LEIQSINQSINQSVSQSVTFAKAPATGDHWLRTSNLIKYVDTFQWNYHCML